MASKGPSQAREADGFRRWTPSRLAPRSAADRGGDRTGPTPAGSPSTPSSASSESGAYANLAAARLLERSGLDARDRRFVTELVYGTTRMRRACDWLVDRFVLRDASTPRPGPPCASAPTSSRSSARPAHAAVGATVAAAPARARGLVNAVLRRVADARPPSTGPTTPPGSATRTGSSTGSPPTSATTTPSPPWRR